MHGHCQQPRGKLAQDIGELSDEVDALPFEFDADLEGKPIDARAIPGVRPPLGAAFGNAVRIAVLEVDLPAFADELRHTFGRESDVALLVIEGL